MSEQARGVRRFVERSSPHRSGERDGHVVAAGKGGIGTSTVALLLAFAARPHGPVVLVDARGGFGGLDHLLGLNLPAPLSLEDGRETVRQTELGTGLVLVHGPADARPESPGHRSALRRAVRSHPGATVIVDAGSRPTTVLQAVQEYGASLVTVVGADAFSPAAAYGLAKLAWRARPEVEVSALGNRITEAQAGLPQEALRSAALRFADRTIAWLGHLPDAPALEALDGPPWATLDQTEPALMAAADAVAGRLLATKTTHSQLTLHRFG